MDFAFTDCVLNLSSRQLTRGGQIVPLEPKMFQLLEVLIQRRPNVVTNNELDELLWPNVYVARTSLTRLVSELRSLLGDSAREPRIIRTVYKTGYAFAADIAAPARVAVRADTYLLWRELRLPLAEGENIAGRGNDCSVIVDAATVSRRHARITVKGRVAMIEDLNSSNGTFVNKVAVSTPKRLHDGDHVAFGTVELILRSIDASAVTVLSGREESDGA